MTSQTDKNSRSWGRAAGGGAAMGALAASLLIGLSTSPAFADPDAQTTETPAPAAEGPHTPCTGGECQPDESTAETPTMSADQALQIIATEYDTGAGGGQISTMIHNILRLRSQGFKPSNANRLAIEKALDARPNQAPLIAALKATLEYQRKLQAQQNNAKQAPAPVAGPVTPIGPTPGPMPGPGVGITGPNGGGVVMPIG
jgi:hypothetical protein